MNAAEARAPVEVTCTVCGYGSRGEWTSRAADRQPINCPTSRGGCGAKVRVKRTGARLAAPAQPARAPAQERHGPPAAPQPAGRPKPPRRPPAIRPPALPTARPPAPYREPLARTIAQIRPRRAEAAEPTRPDTRHYCESCREERQRDKSGLWPKASVHVEVSGSQQFSAYLCAKCFRTACKFAPEGVILHVTEIPSGRHYQLKAS